MIHGEPRIVARAGERMLVDDNGDEVVVRRRTPHRQGTFHQVDFDRFEDGEIRPACNIHGQRESGSWDLGRRDDLVPIWDECERPGCGCAAASEESQGYSSLAGRLRAMSSEEFDREGVDVAAFRGDDR